MYVRIKKAFPFVNERGEKVTAPRGWIGDLPDEHGKAAIQSGHAVPGNPRSMPEAEAAPEAPSDEFAGKTRADLEALAVERGVDVSKAGNKAEVIAMLKAAQA